MSIVFPKRLARKAIPAGTKVCLGLIFLLMLGGCASVQVHMGMKVYLEKIPVKAIEATQSGAPGIAPGQKSPLVVTVADASGVVLQTEGAGHGKILWKDLNVTASVVSVNQKGVLSLPADPRASEGKMGHVSITVPSHPEVAAAELDIPLRYDYAFKANFSGSGGSSGFNGSDGMNGSSGSMGSMDPNNPSAGGDGGNGTDGSNGSDGGAGGDAPPVTVLITLKPGGHPLLEASVTATGHRKLYLVDPQGGSLTVTSAGGAGGQGGKGGRGGSGGSGGMGTPSGNSGSRGSDGRDGSDGQSGRAGSITMTYDPQAKAYLAAIRLLNPGGPRPVINEGPVGPLW